jgi:hypothetical protein
MLTKKFGLVGIANNVQLGKSGPRLKVNSGVIEVKNAADSALAVLRAAAPVGDDDLVTRRYLETRANIIVSGQIDGGSPASPGDGVVYIVTTAGGGFALGELYRRESASWVLLSVQDGTVISIANPLTGGADTYVLGRWQWDLDTTDWVLVGPISETAKTDKNELATILFNSSSPVDIGAVLPSGAIVKKVIVSVSQAFDGTAPTLTIGDVGDTDRLMLDAEIDLKTVGVYVSDIFHLYGANTQVTGTLVPDSSTVGQASVLVEYRLPA